MMSSSDIIIWKVGRIERRPTIALISAPGFAHFAGRVIDTVNLISVMGGALSGAMLFTIAGLMGTEIVVRNLGTSLPFSWEYGAYLMSASFFLAGGFTLLSAGHVRVTFLITESHPVRSYVLEVVGTIIALVVVGTIAWALTDLAHQYSRTGTRSYTQMATPMVVPVALAASGAIVLTLQVLARLLGLAIGRLDLFVFAKTDVQEG